MVPRVGCGRGVREHFAQRKGVRRGQQGEPSFRYANYPVCRARSWCVSARMTDGPPRGVRAYPATRGFARLASAGFAGSILI
ncbi:hypothetical protein FEQ05_02303 [Burkholderia pseudomultivorans]|uniref:Uncharacterized protein n=1 Tax=Burkholderia pseudomultivorans TaxID=1207504 RepID=A0A6P2P949_9BURK|nr:hypothetical protein [Burkholderia pseudomultivorans]MDR8847296.1 hypothetical protein [Burkholderia pseudomultivorans]VWC04282.1 hypothetical protein BPS26883_05056 [Burkholderia pseudomultivorans]